MKIINHLSGHRRIQFEGSEINVYSRNEFVAEDYIGKISHICLSNSEYGIGASGSRMNSGIDYITLTNSALPTIYKDFYRRLYGVDVKSFLVKLTHFDTFQRYMADKADATDFQVFLDVLYYDSLLKEKSRFCGKKIDAVDFSISILGVPIREKPSSEAEIMIQNGASKCRTVKASLCEMGLWGRLVYNLAVELAVVYDDFEPGTKRADEIFSYCKSFVTNKEQGSERTYYLDAWHEVDEFKAILENAKKGDNGFSKMDLARVDYATAPVGSFQVILNNARKGHAFVLKYLVVLNLGMSSGERALLNIMSRICFASQIENYMPGKGIQWNTNILLLIHSYVGLAEEYTVKPESAPDVDKDAAKRIQNTWDLLKLGPLYEKHSDYIRNILRAKQIYTEEYLDQLMKSFPGAFDDMDDLKNVVYGQYTKELWIDRRENSKSLAWSSVLLALNNIKEVGAVVDRPKALGDIRGVTYIYGMFYRFGLIDMPDKVNAARKNRDASWFVPGSVKIDTFWNNHRKCLLNNYLFCVLALYTVFVYNSNRRGRNAP